MFMHLFFFFLKPALHTRQCYVDSREFGCISYDCAASLPPFISKMLYSSASYFRNTGRCPSSSLCSRNTLSRCAGLCKCWRLTCAGVAFTGLVGVARTALSAGTQGAYALLCSGNPMGSITQLHINTWYFSYFFKIPPGAFGGPLWEERLALKHLVKWQLWEETRDPDLFCGDYDIMDGYVY